MSGVTQDEDKKLGDQSIHINLKVKGQDGSKVVFKIKRTTQLKKAHECLLRAEQTPDKLEMEKGDEIDSMLHQTRGSTA